MRWVWKSSSMVTPKQIGMLGPGSRNLDWCGQRRLGTQISSGSLHPVSPASRIPESPRRRDFASPTVLDDRAHDLHTHSHSLRFGREESIKEPWHDLGIDAFPGAEPRSGCAPLPNRTMFPPSPGVAELFDADYAGIQAPRISNKPAVHCLCFSPRLLL
jgi:hypothetical protein